MAGVKVDNIEEMVVFMDTWHHAFNRDPRLMMVYEGKNPMPECRIYGTDIRGMPTDNEFWITFPTKGLPLSKEKYSELEKKLGQRHLVLSNEPEKVIYKPAFNYVIRKRGDEDVVKDGLVQDFRWTGAIRPSQDKSGIEFLWHYEKLNPQKRDTLTVYVFDAVFGNIVRDEQAKNSR